MTDREFLLEISKRLVHKYAEHPSLINRVEEILLKIDNHEKITKSNYKIIQDCVARSINDLKQLHSRLEPICDIEEKPKKQIELSKYFDNLDVENFFKRNFQNEKRQG